MYRRINSYIYIYKYIGARVTTPTPGKAVTTPRTPYISRALTGKTDFRFHNNEPAASHPIHCRHTHNYTFHRPTPLRQRMRGVGHRLAKGDLQYIP